MHRSPHHNYNYAPFSQRHASPSAPAHIPAPALIITLLCSAHTHLDLGCTSHFFPCKISFASKPRAVQQGLCSKAVWPCWSVADEFSLHARTSYHTAGAGAGAAVHLASKGQMDAAHLCRAALSEALPQPLPCLPTAPTRRQARCCLPLLRCTQRSIAKAAALSNNRTDTARKMQPAAAVALSHSSSLSGLHLPLPCNSVQ